MRSSQKTLALWAFLVVGALILFQAYNQKAQKLAKEFTFTTFYSAIEAGEIDSVTIVRDKGEIYGKIKPEFKEKYGAEAFSIAADTDFGIFEKLNAAGVTVKYENAESNSLLTSVFISWLPMIILFLMILFFMRQIQAGGGKAMSFGKSRAKLLTENKNKVTFNDVAGVEEAKEELVEVVDFLKEPKKYTRLGGRIPKGLLLAGSPGTGKTLLARAVAGEAGVPFFSISGSDFVEMFVGVGASRVRDLFEQGKKSAPCIIFIDEIDAVGRHRGAGMGGGHDEREQTLDQLLVEMDGFESTDGVILIAATNRPDILDPALLRPGRFDRRVMVGKPDVKGREQILKVHSKKNPLSKEVDLAKIAKATPGFTGADLENLVNESALMAARENKSQLDMNDFEKAKDKVQMGAERKSMVMSLQDRKITAYHEAGHTLVAKLVANGDPVGKVSIVPRGMALGVTQIQPEEDRLNYSLTKAKAMLAYLFGGRVAEEIVFKDITSGASNDIQKATDIARKMVTEWGMSEKLGPLAYERDNGPVFLGMNHSGSPEGSYSEKVAEEIDNEVRALIDWGLKEARRICTEHRDKLELIALALLEFETIDGAEIRSILDGKNLEDLKKSRESRESELHVENKESEKVLADKEKEEEAKKDEDKKDDKDSVGGSDPVMA
ncbi:MAG: ATP-dependent zinc metalloprotease FtsH [Bdellovibrionales bacterium]